MPCRGAICSNEIAADGRPEASGCHPETVSGNELAAYSIVCVGVATVHNFATPIFLDFVHPQRQPALHAHVLLHRVALQRLTSHVPPVSLKPPWASFRSPSEERKSG